MEFHGVVTSLESAADVPPVLLDGLAVVGLDPRGMQHFVGLMNLGELGPGLLKLGPGLFVEISGPATD